MATAEVEAAEIATAVAAATDADRDAAHRSVITQLAAIGHGDSEALAAFRNGIIPLTKRRPRAG